MTRLIPWLACVTAISIGVAGLVGCSKQIYHPKPVSTETVVKKLSEKSPSSAAFEAYLLKQGYPKEHLPIKVWGIDELTYSALFHHAALDLAKAKLAVVESNVAIADLKPNPTANANLGQSDQANGDINPWTYGFTIDVPIETANKREIRVEEAQQLADAARMDVADTAWQLRHQLNIDLIDYHQNQSTIRLLRKEVATQRQLLAMLDKRLALGLASNTDVSRTALDLKRKEGLLFNEEANTNAIIAKIATDAGLTLDQFKPNQIKEWSIDDTIAKQNVTLSSPSMQQETLLNRIDIRRSLANYAAAEAKIKLEIAKQTPDISISPGFLFEFGDKVWTLGFSSLLNLINNQQPTLIKHAEQLREAEGAQFEALQANVIGLLAQALAKYESFKPIVSQFHDTKIAEEQHFNRLKKQFDAGLIDRLTLAQASLSNIASEQQYQQAQFTLLRLQANIENIVQKPLISPANLLLTEH